MSNENKMREEFETYCQNERPTDISRCLGGYYQNKILELKWHGWKACAAIKDAEIARLKDVPMKYKRMEFNAQLQSQLTVAKKEIAEGNERWKDLRNVLESTQKEVASRDLMIKERDEALEKIAFMGMDKPMQADGEYFYQSQLRNCVSIAAQALANSEHHNSRALEQMLLEARIEEVKKFELGLISNVQEYKTFLALKLAELNKE